MLSSFFLTCFPVRQLLPPTGLLSQTIPDMAVKRPIYSFTLYLLTMSHSFPLLPLPRWGLCDSHSSFISPKGLHTRSLSPGTWDIWNIWMLGASLILLLSLRGLSGDAFPLSLMKLFCTRCYNSLRNIVGFMVSQMGQKRLWISLRHPIWTK